MHYLGVPFVCMQRLVLPGVMVLDVWRRHTDGRIDWHTLIFIVGDSLNPRNHSGQVRYGSMCQNSVSLRSLSAGTPGASVWPSPRQMPGPSPSLWDAGHPAATTRHVVGPLASSTHETPSLRESGEQDQRQENEPHVLTVATDAHGLCR